jgi:hypothetical protein
MVVAYRNRRRKHVEGARIVLASADRGSAQRVAQSIRVGRPTGSRSSTRYRPAQRRGRVLLVDLLPNERTTATIARVRERTRAAE